MAVDTKELYDFVQFVMNKEQQGFVKTSEFVMAAESAQIELVRDRLGRPEGNQPGRPVARMGYGSQQIITDDLRHLIRGKDVVAAEENDGLFGGGVATNQYSSYDLSTIDYIQIISIQREKTTGTALSKTVKIVDAQEFYSALDSAAFVPTHDYPIGSFLGANTSIPAAELVVAPKAPDKVFEIRVNYIKNPIKGTLTESINASTGVITVTTNQTMSDVPKSLFNELAWRVLSIFGLNLREASITQFAEMQEKEVA